MRPKQRLAVALAGVAPDLDGLGIVVDITSQALHLRSPGWYGLAHHVLLHGLIGAVLIAGCTAFATPRDERGSVGYWRLAIWAVLMVHLHLLCDFLGSAGPGRGQLWPITYFSPVLDTPGWVWSGQWLLNGWQNLSPSCGLLGWVCVRAARDARSPLEVIAPRMHLIFVNALRSRFKVSS